MANKKVSKNQLCKKTSVPRKRTIRKKPVKKKDNLKSVKPEVEKFFSDKDLNDKIFVQIAAYRDDELLPTLRDMFSKAINSKRLCISICWQHAENDSLEEFANNDQIKLIDVFYKDAKGVCWARNKLNELYDNEEYMMQLDSHHRFEVDWDKKLIQMMNQLKDKGHKKPVLSAYVPSYEPGQGNDEGKIREPWKLNFDRFLPEGPPVFRPATLDNWRNIECPVPARFMSGHFIFADGTFVKDVPYDPELYFYGEEISIAVRAYTHGYDLFHPHTCVVWHHYTRKGAIRQWDDHSDWNVANMKAYARVSEILGVDMDSPISCEKYGLGSERSLDDYEKYAGIRFRDRGVQQYTLDFHLAPNPVIDDEEKYNNSFIKKFEHCLDIWEGEFTEKDYDLIVVEFLDNDGHKIRCDLDKEASMKLIMSGPEDQFYRIWRSAYIDWVPDKFILWPHSESKGWMNRLELPIPKSQKRIRPKNPISLWKDFDESKSFKIDTKRTANERKIFLHIPAYRDPELVPTIEDAIKNAKNPDRLVFGICYQDNPDDTFEKIDKYRDDKRFKIIDIHYTEAKGLPFARYQCNTMITDEDYVLQLDSHHRFVENWDEILIDLHDGLKEDGYEKPIIGGYLPFYEPHNDPAGRVKIPYQSIASCFYPHGSLFIRPSSYNPSVDLSKPVPARFLSGHFSFADSHWAKTIKHDVDLYFSGEEINLTLRSWTNGYDIFNLNKVVIWHSMERKERNGILIWDDQYKRGDHSWSTQQDTARAKNRQLFRVEDNNFDLTGYDLGTERSLAEYEKYTGFNFKEKTFNKAARENLIPSLSLINNETDETEKYNDDKVSFYHLVNITKDKMPATDYVRILVAYDDENGIGLNTKFIEGPELQKFMYQNATIHYEDYLFLDKMPKKVVYWGYSDSRGWAERVENIL